MVLICAFGWVLLAMAVAAVVNDCLAWWSDGAFRLLALGELWARLDFDSLERVQLAIQRHLSSTLWAWVVLPVLRLPALPLFMVAGVLLLWVGRRISGLAEPGLMGSRPRRRRRARSGLS